jgi:hypothetical protein
VSKDYSEFLVPKHKSVWTKQKVFWQNTFKSVLNGQNTFESVLLWQNTFEIYLLGLFTRIGEKLFQWGGTKAYVSPWQRKAT